jgi:hypothetical protein
MEKVLHVHPTGRGIYIGTEKDETKDGKLKIEEKNSFRNEGHPQYVGGPKLGQNYGGRKTAKVSVLSQVRDKLKEERLFALHTDMQHLYERLGMPPVLAVILVLSTIFPCTSGNGSCFPTGCGTHERIHRAESYKGAGPMLARHALVQHVCYQPFGFKIPSPNGGAPGS